MGSWNERTSELTSIHDRRRMGGVSIFNQREQTKSCLNDQVQEFLAKGGTIKKLPSCQCAIDARTNKPFQAAYSNRVVK